MPGSRNDDSDKGGPLANMPDDEMAEELAEAAEALAEVGDLEQVPEDRDLIVGTDSLPSTENLEDSTLNFVQSFNRQLDQIQEMKDTLEAEMVKLKKVIATRDKTIALERKRAAGLDKQLEHLAALEVSSERLQAEIEARDKEIEALKVELSAQAARVEQKSSAITELKSGHQTMLSKIAGLKHDLQSAKEECARQEALVEALNGEREDLLGEKRRLEEAMNQLDAKYQAARDEVLSARKILGELQSAFETSQRKARTILERKLRGPEDAATS